MKKIVSLLFILFLLSGCTNHSCTVIFDCGQLGIYEVKTDVNEYVDAPKIMSPEGYILKGWLDENGESFNINERIARDITLYPDFGRLYTVYFVSDSQQKEIVRVEENKIVSKPANPFKQDYFFGGWYYHGREFDFSTPITSDMTLTANWLKGYNVDYLDENDNVLYHLYVSAGSQISDCLIPEKEGYKADSWYCGQQPYDFNRRISSDLSLKAHYLQLYTVTFVCDDIYSYTMAAAEGDMIERPDDPVKENYLFMGWYYNNKPYDFSQKITDNIVLQAHYLPLWKVTVNCNNASDGKNSIYIVKDKDKLNPLPQLNKTGCVFVGYYCNGKPYDFNSIIESDITLTAIFRKILYVTFQPDNGQPETKVQILENDIIEKPADPFKEGYQFAGWYLNDQQFDFQSKITSNIVLTALWQ